ncbi:hypothetical protein FBZ89_102264 [Nitrospirillum amazonense]|uniref:Uncharacterized protein n=1 Tax=Nitrospirillum amazonense TaxID=28077 RepID=A0A560FPF8_9PROT|nr:hypothetical protein FBZ89_102264 [Nitrospirillum amazonense]
MRRRGVSPCAAALASARCFLAEGAQAQKRGLIRIQRALPALRGSKRIGAFRDFVMHELRKAPMGKAA